MTTVSRFLIDNTEFGVGQVTFSINPTANTFTVEIVGDEAIAASIGAAESHPFNWISYPPHFYVRDAVFTHEGDIKTLDIDEDALDEYDIALYLMEHNDVLGTFTLTADGLITVVGTVAINGNAVKLAICARASPVAHYQ